MQNWFGHIGQSELRCVGLTNDHRSLRLHGTHPRRLLLTLALGKPARALGVTTPRIFKRVLDQHWHAGQGTMVNTDPNLGARVFFEARNDRIHGRIA